MEMILCCVCGSPGGVYFSRYEYHDETEGDQGEKVYLTDSVTFVTEGAYDEDIDEGICAYDRLAEPIKVWWARKLPQKTLLSMGARYGNGVSMDKYYGNACIVTSW